MEYSTSYRPTRVRPCRPSGELYTSVEGPYGSAAVPQSIHTVPLPPPRPLRFSSRPPRPYDPQPDTTYYTQQEVEISRHNVLPIVRRLDDKQDRHGGHQQDLIIISQDAEPRDLSTTYLIICLYHNGAKDWRAHRVRLRDTKESGKGRPRKDVEFINALTNAYKNHLRGRVRRILSFKTLSTVRLMKFGKGELTSADQIGPLFSPKFIKLYQNPELYLTDDSREWTKWFIREKDALHDLDMDMALELKEDYDIQRVFGVIMLGLATLLILSVIWILEGGDSAYMSTVMSYVLTFFAAIVGLTGLWDSLDKGHTQATYEGLIQD